MRKLRYQFLMHIVCWERLCWEHGPCFFFFSCKFLLIKILVRTIISYVVSDFASLIPGFVFALCGQGFYYLEWGMLVCRIICLISPTIIPCLVFLAFFSMFCESLSDYVYATIICSSWLYLWPWSNHSSAMSQYLSLIKVNDSYF